jgi:hypothetical protein
VNVAVVLAPAFNATLAGLSVQVGKLCAPLGEAIKLQDKLIVPE